MSTLCALPLIIGRGTCVGHTLSYSSACVSTTQDFATSSLKGEVATENEEDIVMGTLEEYTISERKEWEKR